MIQQMVVSMQFPIFIAGKNLCAPAVIIVILSQLNTKERGVPA
jgi:hypothetical protein